MTEPDCDLPTIELFEVDIDREPCGCPTKEGHSCPVPF
jgi:hypothetical protein